MKTTFVLSFFVAVTVFFVYCTKNAQIVAPTTSSTNELISYKTSVAPTIDGTADAIWGNATKLAVTPSVPDPGNNLFTGYIGEVYPSTIQSMYDDQNIYFFVEVTDKVKNFRRQPWYFDPIKQLWAQETGSRTYDASGVLTREGYGEDKFAMLWNINGSTPKFITQTCYASCHVFTPYTDYSGTTPITKSNASSGNHYTNGVNEKIDMWWAHPSRGLVYNVMDDNYQDWAGGPAVTSLVGGSGNGRHFDDLVVSGASTTWPYAPTYTSDATQGSFNNTQKLKLDGTGATVSVPLFVIPNSTKEYLTIADTTAGIAKRITGVSSTGVLTFSGGSIDPNVGTDYQRVGNPVTGGVGAKGIPYAILSPVLKGRADISCTAVYTGTSWIYEFSRKLKTSDVLNQDVDFSSLTDQPFGVAYWNNSNYQHGINPNLLLKFAK